MNFSATPGAGGRKKDRPEIFLELTRSICPVCRRVVDADVLTRENKVFMHKFCPEHGWFDALISSDLEHYRAGQRFNKPGAIPLSFAAQVEKGCPEDCGLCPEHKQHTCLGLIEITDACNLQCPTCLADSRGKNFLSLEQVKKMLELLVVCEGNPGVVQISGGEPTLHPRLFEIIAAARDMGIKSVQLNTNGIRIAEDDAFLEGLARLKPSIYLQFDGFTPAVYRRLRGADLADLKLKALDRLAGLDFNIVLAATVVKGVNDDQVGRIAELAVNHRLVRGVMFQPVAYTGRHPACDPMNRTTLPDVVAALEKQTGGLLVKEDFIPIPCPYPTCFSVTYVYRGGGEVTTLPRLVNVEEYLDYFKNRFITDLSPLTLEALEGLWSACATPGSAEVGSNFACCCGFSPESLKELEQDIIMIGIHALMDAHTFDLKRARKCCIHQVLPGGKMVPLCVYNNLRRGCAHG